MAKGLFHLSILKHHPGLIPLFVIMGVGCSLAVFTAVRTSLKSPDVKWVNRKTEPWQEYEKKQYKLYNPSGFDYSKGTGAPKYEEE